MSFRGMLFRKGFALLAGWGDKKRDRGLCEPSGLTVYRSLPYTKESDGRTLDIYVPEGARGLCPVLVSAHGGGFCYGDKELYRFYCMELAGQGFAVVNFDYRLFPARFPAPIEDMGLVMRFLEENANRYALDLKNCFAVGDSAGATMVALYAAAQFNPAYQRELGVPMSGLKFNAVALHSGVFPSDEGEIRTNAALWDWLGKDNNAAKENAQKVLFDRIGAFPPAFFSYSVNDAITQDTPAFCAALRRVGTECELHAYGREDKKVGHVFHLDIRSPYAQDCMKKQTAFLKRYFR